MKFYTSGIGLILDLCRLSFFCLAKNTCASKNWRLDIYIGILPLPVTVGSEGFSGFVNLKIVILVVTGILGGGWVPEKYLKVSVCFQNIN